MATTDPDRPRDDISIHDTMRVIDGVVRPPGSAWPNGASQVPAALGATDAEQEANGPGAAPDGG